MSPRPASGLRAPSVGALLALAILLLPASSPLPFVDGVVERRTADSERLPPAHGPVLQEAPASTALGAFAASPTVERGPTTRPGPAGLASPLLDRLAAQGALTPAQLVDAVRLYFHDSGLNAPGDCNGCFEPENVVSYTYNLGDADGDGDDDVALDTYCIGEGCRQEEPSPLADPAGYVNYHTTEVAGGPLCGYRHRVGVVSGRSGEPLWQRRLDRPATLEDFGVAVPNSVPLPPSPALPPLPVAVPPLPGGLALPTELWLALPNACAQEFLVGTAPLADGRTGLLVYRYVATYPFGTRPEDPWWTDPILIRHRIYLMDPTDGRTLWEFAASGLIAYAGTPVPQSFAFHAENLTLNPILQVPPRDGVAWVPRGTRAGLFLQGVSFDFVYKLLDAMIPGTYAPYPLVDAYWPNEWAAKLDLDSGAVEWQRATITSDLGQSVWPTALFGPTPFDPFEPGAAGLVKPDWYWNYQPCCFDLTGDGIPDLLYTTQEWNPYPSTNTAGSYFVSSHAVAFDGATGDPLWSTLVEPGTRERVDCGATCFAAIPQALGDVDADGAADVLVHLTYRDFDYYHNFTVLSGRTGDELWAHESRHNLALVVVGDADADGGNDFVLTKWFFSSWGYHGSNVTVSPVTLYNGRDGHPVWRTTTFQAPIDILFGFDLYRLNGVPDLNADGIGDVMVDDPIYFPDLTVVHRQTFVSGRDASPLLRYAAVGTFGFPALAGDLTGDGVDDLGLLSGDVNDLWITVYDGAQAEAEWSRRILATRSSSYASALPRIKFHALANADEPARDLMINIQLQVGTAGGFVGNVLNLPQLAVFGGPNGTHAWSLPKLDPDMSATVPGATPLAAAYERAYAGTPKAQTLASLPTGTRAVVGLAAFAVAALAGFIVTQRRRTP